MKQPHLGRRVRRYLVGAVGTMSVVLFATACSSTPCPADGCTESELQSSNTKGTVMDSPTDQAVEKSMENVGQIQFDGKQVTASVVSTGCTRSDDFSIVEDVQEGSCQLQLVRNKPDFCRRAPFSVEVAVAWQPSSECEDLPIEFVNPVVEMLSLAQNQNPARSVKLKKP